MPAAGYTYHRDTIIDRELFEKFLDQYPEYNQLDYDTFKDVILESNKGISSIIVNEDQGFKLPENLGYIAVTAYKPSKRKAINWESTHKYGKRIFHNNVHSFGFSFKIRWFKAGIAKFRHNKIYKFKACRLLGRAVAKMGKEGKVYSQWRMADFGYVSKLERSFRKQFKVSE